VDCLKVVLVFLRGVKAKEMLGRDDVWGGNKFSQWQSFNGTKVRWILQGGMLLACIGRKRMSSVQMEVWVMSCDEPVVRDWHADAILSGMQVGQDTAVLVMVSRQHLAVGVSMGCMIFTGVLSDVPLTELGHAWIYGMPQRRHDDPGDGTGTVVSQGWVLAGRCAPAV
jgi:hypothetical protein